MKARDDFKTGSEYIQYLRTYYRSQALTGVTAANPNASAAWIRRKVDEIADEMMRPEQKKD